MNVPGYWARQTFRFGRKIAGLKKPPGKARVLRVLIPVYDMNKGNPSDSHAKAKAKAEKDLCEAILALRDADECRRFLHDLCTPKEITDLSDRWWIARLLDEGKHSYREIHDMTGISVTTVGRVARFLQQENFQGYRLLLDHVKSKK
jgi:TrpR-related protein YerC/YecD